MKNVIVTDKSTMNKTVFYFFCFVEKGYFDEIRIGVVGRQGKKPCFGILDGFANALDLVGG